MQKHSRVTRKLRQLLFSGFPDVRVLSYFTANACIFINAPEDELVSKHACMMVVNSTEWMPVNVGLVFDNISLMKST